MIRMLKRRAVGRDVTVKVCFVAPDIYPLFNPMVRKPHGGAEAQLYELARRLAAEESFEASVVTGDCGQEAVEYYDGVMAYRHGFETGAPAWRGWFGKATPLDDVLRQTGADVFATSGAGDACAAVGDFCRKHRRAHVHRVAHQRECDRSYAESKGERGARFREALRNASRVVVQTEEQKALLRRMEGVDSTVIPNALPLTAPAETGRFQVVWIGQALPWKQPELFMRMALTLPEGSFTMFAMPGEPEYFEKLVEKTRDIPNLGFQNSVPYHEMPSFLARALLLVNTSRFEGFPFSFSQAMANGIPVVSLNADPDGILEKRQTGVCAHGSEVTAIEAVRDLLAYPRQWQRMAGNALRLAAERFDMEKAVTSYKTLFAQLAAREVGRP